jgi:hypothetical protein
MAIFQNQSLLTIELDTEIDISSATTTDIYYEKPDGTTTGTWTGSVGDTTKVTYDVGVSDFDTVGTWRLQAFVTIAGESAYGKVVRVEVLEPIT